MKAKTFLFTAALVALVPLAACTTTSTGPSRPVDFTFSYMEPISLNVGAVQVLDASDPNAPKMSRVSPSQALQSYARRRLKAVGGEGTLNFVIQQASVSAAESQGTGDWTEAFQLSKPMEYTVTMRVGLDLEGRTTRPNIRSAYTLERKKTLPAGASLADRDRELNKLIETMVRDMDQAVQTGLANNMRIMVTPGAITFGNPAPLETQGQDVVQPGPASAAPVVIQGTMD
jgi:hypothetical protein